MKFICYDNQLLTTGIHPTIISESFQKALEKGIQILTDMSQPVELSDRETLLNSATTSLNSKVRPVPKGSLYSYFLKFVKICNSSVVIFFDTTQFFVFCFFF